MLNSASNSKKATCTDKQVKLTKLYIYQAYKIDSLTFNVKKYPKANMQKCNNQTLTVKNYLYDYSQ